MTDTKTYDRFLAALAQSEYCKQTLSPNFSGTGHCPRCRISVYTGVVKTSIGGRVYVCGISVEEAGKSLVTGCPHCNYSFV